MVAYNPMLFDQDTQIDSAIDRSGLVRLPAAVDKVFAIGGGDFLFLRMPFLNVIAVFDVLHGRISAYLLNINGRITGTLSGFFHQASLDVDSSIVQRWQYPDLKLVHKNHLGRLRSAGIYAGNADDLSLFVLAGPSKKRVHQLSLIHI